MADDIHIARTLDHQLDLTATCCGGQPGFFSQRLGSNPPIAVTFRLPIAQVNSVQHGVTGEPMVIGPGGDWIGASAQQSPLQIFRNRTDDL